MRGLTRDELDALDFVCAPGEAILPETMEPAVERLQIRGLLSVNDFGDPDWWFYLPTPLGRLALRIELAMHLNALV